MAVTGFLLALVYATEEPLAEVEVAKLEVAKKDKVWPADLHGQDFIGFDEDLSIRRELDKFLRANGAGVNLTMHFSTISRPPRKL
jgi:hypothetical protein